MNESLNTQIIIGVCVAGVVGALGLYAYMSPGNKKKYERVGTVSKLYLHPMKSMTAIEVQEGEVTERGFKSCGIYDRCFMVIDENERGVSGRRCPKLILIKPRLSDDRKSIILSAEGKDDISIPLEQTGRVISSRICISDVEGQDCGDEVAEWLSDFLEGTYRMIFRNSGLPNRTMTSSNELSKYEKDFAAASFQDVAQFHILSEASLEVLNSKLEKKVTAKTFRPNIFVKGCAPYAEDFWKYVKIGEKAEMKFLVFCPRCKMTTLNHETGSFAFLDTMRTMKEYRQCYDFVTENRKTYQLSPIMGTYLTTEKLGKVKVGDPVFASLQYQGHVGDTVKNQYRQCYDFAENREVYETPPIM